MQDVSAHLCNLNNIKVSVADNPQFSPLVRGSGGNFAFFDLSDEFNWNMLTFVNRKKYT